MRLYTYWQSTTSYRVRIALALKKLDYESKPVNLLAGNQRSEEYAALNPIKGVPTLITDDGLVISQSMAILDHLDHLVPLPPLLPNDDLALRSKILSAALLVATDIHPVNNLKVISHLKAVSGNSGVGESWMKHWMQEGFEAFSRQINNSGQFCFGDEPTLADVCLVPQLYNAHRWQLDLGQWPRFTEIEENCLALEAFQQALPENQKDAT